MSTTTKHFALISVVAVLASSAGTAAADENFRAKSLKGAWGFTAAGTLFLGLANQAPAVAVGIATFDGVSGCTSEAKLNVGGTLISVAAASCSYSVNADGTGTQVTVFPTLGASFRTDFVIVDNAKEFRFIISDVTQPGRTIADGVAKRQ